MNKIVSPAYSLKLKSVSPTYSLKLKNIILFLKQGFIFFDVVGCCHVIST